MLEICEQYALNHKILFNGQKANISISQKNKNQSIISFKPFDVKIPCVTSVKHFGHTLCNNVTDGFLSGERIIDRFNKSVNILMAKFGNISFDILQLRADSLAGALRNKQYNEFWKNVKARGASKTSYPATIDDNVGDSNILQMWVDHYKLKFSSTIHGEGRMEKIYTKAQNVTTNEFSAIESKELEKIISKLKKNKATDSDNLCSEHFINAIDCVKKPLSLLYTSLLVHGYMAQKMIKSEIIPVIKNKGKSVTDKSNYKPIAISTIVSKIFEYVLLNRLEPYLYTSSNQFGFKVGLGTKLCVFSLLEIVRNYNTMGSHMFLCFLDASSAFDRICFVNLFEKLIKRNIPMYLLRIVIFWYINQKLCVKWKSTCSEYFTVINGVRQGGILSTHLFNVYMDDLSISLNKLHIGCCIKDQLVNHFMYADDTVLLAPSVKGLQKLIDITSQYGIEHSIKFNKTKSVCMYIVGKGQRWNSDEPALFLGKDRLSMVSEYCYLGHIICNNLKDNSDIDKQIRSLYCRANSLKRKFKHCSEAVLCLLFKTFCSTIYCSGLWCAYTNVSWNRIRTAYNNSFRIMLGLPKYCSATDMFVSRNVDTFDAYIRKQYFSLRTRLYNCNNVYVNTITHCDLVMNSVLFKRMEYALHILHRS